MDLKEKMKNKMKGEIPVFKRCCCCLPLRYGLLAWGYFKIAIDICFIPVLAYYLVLTIFMIGMFGQSDGLKWILFYFTLVIFATTTFLGDVIMTIIFIIGGHMKSVKLLKPYYIYSIVILVLTTLITTSAVCLSLTDSFTTETTMQSWDNLLIIYAAYFVILVVQSYFILLLRSEIIKLRDQAETFRFVNNAAEAECTMVCKEKLALPSPDTETEDV